jgi:hypothetical protein
MVPLVHPQHCIPYIAMGGPKACDMCELSRVTTYKGFFQKYNSLNKFRKFRNCQETEDLLLK